MAKKKVAGATTKKEKIEEATNTGFDQLDKLISKQFNDLLDLSKVDTAVDTFYDWGVYSLNYICSKDLTGGIPKGRVTGIEGLPGSGKSLLTACAARDPKIDYVIIIETEGGGQGDELMTFAGVDKRKVRIMKAHTFGSYKTNKKSLKIEEIKDSEVPKNLDTDTYFYVEGVTSKIRRFIQSIKFNGVKQNILIILDSLANIQSVRALAGTKDMGARGQDFNNFFKNFDNAFEEAGMTFVFTNKLYTNFDEYNPWASAGGVSPKYNSSLYVRLQTTSLTDDVSDGDMKNEKAQRKTALGSSLKTIKARVEKSRFGTEMRNIPFLLDFISGPVKFSGLFSLCRDFGILTSPSNGWYEFDGVIDGKFRKKDFIPAIAKDEENLITKIQKLLEAAEIKIKEEHQNLQANDLEETKNVEEDLADEDKENPFGDMNTDDLKKQMIKDVE